MSTATVLQSTSTPEGARRRSPRRIMIFAIVLLAISQFLPFGSNPAFMRDRRNDDPDAVLGVDHNAYSEHPYLEVDGGGSYIGFDSHPYAVPILIVLAVIFFSGLYRKPTWNGKVYWGALVISIGCTEFPPPIGSLSWGGGLGAICLAMIAYAAYINMQEQAKKV